MCELEGKHIRPDIRIRTWEVAGGLKGELLNAIFLLWLDCLYPWHYISNENLYNTCWRLLPLIYSINREKVHKFHPLPEELYVIMVSYSSLGLSLVSCPCSKIYLNLYSCKQSLLDGVGPHIHKKIRRQERQYFGRRRGSVEAGQR